MTQHCKISAIYWFIFIYLFICLPCYFWAPILKNVSLLYAV